MRNTFFVVVPENSVELENIQDENDMEMWTSSLGENSVLCSNDSCQTAVSTNDKSSRYTKFCSKNLDKRELNHIAGTFMNPDE